MSEYTDDTFKPIWCFIGEDGQSYVVLQNLQTETFHLYESLDVTEIAYKNVVVRKDFEKLSGTFFDDQRYFYLKTANNTLHCDTGPAAFVPCGLEVFRPREDVAHYAVHGKLMSLHTWLTWVKGTPSWTTVMANLLGSKSPE